MRRQNWARHTRRIAAALRAILGASLLFACAPEPKVQWALGTEGTPVRWKQLPPTLTIAPPPNGTLLRWSEVHAAAEHALVQWGLESRIELLGGGERIVSEDGVNMLLIASRRAASQAEVAHGTHAETELYLRTAPEGFSEIVEADIVVPLSSVDWAGPARTTQLQALLVHELGHYLGLGHNCALGVSPGASSTCDANPKFEQQAMFPDALLPRGGAELRPSPAELAAVAERYGAR
jgi:hypothetical protein